MKPNRRQRRAAAARSRRRVKRMLVVATGDARIVSWDADQASRVAAVVVR